MFISPIMPAITPLIIFQLIAFGLSVGFAFWYNRKHRKYYPDRRPYRWGYFYGAISVLGGLSVVYGVTQSLPIGTNIWLAFGFFSAVALMMVLFGVSIIFRRPWAWVFSILFCIIIAGRIYGQSGDMFSSTLFMILGLFNAAYFWRRRQHLARFFPSGFRAFFLAKS